MRDLAIKHVVEGVVDIFDVLNRSKVGIDALDRAHQGEDDVLAELALDCLRTLPVLLELGVGQGLLPVTKWLWHSL